MRKFFRGLSEAPYKLMAMATLATMSAGEAMAQTGGFGDVGNNISSQFDGVGKMVLGGAFLGGVGFCGAGLMKLKAAADTQGQQVKYSEGLWRLGVGAGLVALPTVAVVGKSSLFGNNATQLQNNGGGIQFRVN